MNLTDEADNAYGGLYSGSVAGHSLKPGWEAALPTRALAFVLAHLIRALIRAGPAITATG
ncbi:MAG: hypothetical protein ACREXV_00775 [Polaromonas sp.]